MAEKNNKINIYFVTKNNDNDKTISMDMKQAFLVIFSFYYIF